MKDKAPQLRGCPIRKPCFCFRKEEEKGFVNKVYNEKKLCERVQILAGSIFVMMRKFSGRPLKVKSNLDSGDSVWLSP